MTFLPIQFRSKLEILDNEINVTDALDIVEDYFRENNYNYIKRKKDRVIFHKANGWSSLNFKSLEDLSCQYLLIDALAFPVLDDESQ